LFAAVAAAAPHGAAGVAVTAGVAQLAVLAGVAGQLSAAGSGRGPRWVKLAVRAAGEFAQAGGGRRRLVKEVAGSEAEWASQVPSLTLAMAPARLTACLAPLSRGAAAARGCGQSACHALSRP